MTNWRKEQLELENGFVKNILINYNILFAEPDRMSGVEYLKSMPMSNELRKELGTVLLDTDAVFSTVLKESGRAVILMLSLIHI